MFEYNLDISKNSYMRICSTDSSSPDFPFQLYEEGYFEAGEDYFTERDNKPMYLLIYTTAGDGVVRSGGRFRHLGAGDAVLLNCRNAHDYRTVSATPWCFHWVHFDASSLGGYAKALCDELTVVEIDEKMKLVKLFEEIRKLPDEVNTVKKNAKTVSLLSQMMLIMVNSRFPSAEEESDSVYTHDAVGRACAYIEEHLTESISIEALADLVHLSKFYFIRLFKKHMGISPYHYVQVSRINRAKELLCSTDFRIGQISDMTGFCNAARFTKLFQDMVGTTPTKFRRNSFKFNQDLLEEARQGKFKDIGDIDADPDGDTTDAEEGTAGSGTEE